SLAMFDAGKPAAGNVAVTQLVSSESLVTFGRPVQFTAELRNFGEAAVSKSEVQLFVDGQPVEKQTVTIPAGEATSVVFSHRFDTPGEHEVEVRSADDALNVDNHRWLSVPVRESIRVLCIDGKPDASRYVALALEPRRNEQARVRVDQRPETALLETDLTQYDCVVLCNVGRFGRDEARTLLRYLKNGGGLITFLGDNVQPASYNEQLLRMDMATSPAAKPTDATINLPEPAEQQVARVLPARIETLQSGGPFLFDPLEYRHPIVEPFAGHPRSGLLTTPVWRYYQLAPASTTTSRVALAFHTGDPAIVDEPIERGRSLLVATAASPDSVDQSVTPPQVWTAWPTWPSFPPMMQEMLALAVESGMNNRNVAVGEPIVGSIHSTVANLPLTIVSPDSRELRVPLAIDGEDSRWSFDDTTLSGVYRAEYGPPLSTTQLFVANVDTRESRLERFDADLLPSQFRQDFSAEHSDQPTFPVTRGAGLFRVFLFGVLGLLLTESVLAWRFGRTN
ncbi:MAG: hypothetical protein KDA71_02630, partial [Planctomycetales bacterium]|nr:hypothetical protein [Planctomycetales bacterium]